MALRKKLLNKIFGSLSVLLSNRAAIAAALQTVNSPQRKEIVDALQVLKRDVPLAFRRTADAHSDRQR